MVVLLPYAARIVAPVGVGKKKQVEKKRSPALAGLRGAAL